MTLDTRDDGARWATCTMSCCAAGYDPTACAEFGCQALRHLHSGGRMADFNQSAKVDPRYSGRDAATLRAVSMPLDDLEKMINDSRERILQQTEQVKKLADQVLGAEPEASGPRGVGIADQPPRPGKTGSLLDAAGYLHNCISGLQYQLDRLGPLFG